jgi:hypothetical protein
MDLPGFRVRSSQARGPASSYPRAVDERAAEEPRQSRAPALDSFGSLAYLRRPRVSRRDAVLRLMEEPIELRQCARGGKQGSPLRPGGAGGDIVGERRRYSRLA